jgi:hypothetical protein
MFTRRTISICMVAVAVTAFMGRAALAEDKVHEGTVVSVEKDKLTMAVKTDDKKHTHVIGTDVKITLDGKTAKLEELKAGYQVKVTTDEKGAVTKVDAMTKPKTP